MTKLGYMYRIMSTYCIAFTLGMMAVLGMGVQSISADTIEYKTIPISSNGEILVVNENNENLFVGGSFTSIQIGSSSPVLRNNIAAISLETKAISPWNPLVEIVVRSIKFDEDTMTVKDYVETEPNRDSERKQIIIETVSGKIFTELPTPTPIISTDTVMVVEASEPSDPEVAGLMVDRSKLGFKIPTLSDILTFAIRGFFVISGLAALFFLLMGALTWITSGGDKDSVQAAKDKMQAAIVGVLMMVAVLAIVWTLEQVVFRKQICFGLSCPISLPTLLEPT